MGPSTLVNGDPSCCSVRQAGWMFPSAEGTLRTPNSLDRAWAKCLRQAGITKRFTVHGLRYTFTDLVRRANVDAVVRRALTGHVTEEMQRHYSTVGLDEKRAAIAGVLRLVPPDPRREDGGGGSRGGSEFTPTWRSADAMPSPAFPTRDEASGVLSSDLADPSRAVFEPRRWE
jgi:hypothetical protein